MGDRYADQKYIRRSVRKFDEVKAVKWLKKKEIMERSYGELMENVVSTRKGLLAEGFEGKHIALIGTSSVEWMEVIWESSPDVPAPPGRADPVQGIFKGKAVFRGQPKLFTGCLVDLRVGLGTLNISPHRITSK